MRDYLTSSDVAELFDVPPWLVDGERWPLWRRLAWRLRHPWRRRP